MADQAGSHLLKPEADGIMEILFFVPLGVFASGNVCVFLSLWPSLYIVYTANIIQ